MHLNATIFGQLIAFVFFVWFCMKYIWPPIMLAIKTRQKNISESLIAVEKAKQEFLSVQQKIEQTIQDSKKKASFILNEANTKKLLILEEAKKEAILNSKKIFIQNQLEIDKAVMHARERLRQDIVDISVLIAEKIIEKNAEKDVNKALIDKLIISLSEIKN